MSNSPYGKSFGFRLFRTFSVIVMVFAIFFAIAVVSYQKRLVTGDLVKEGKMISILLGSSLKPWIFAENPAMLKDALKDIMEYRNVTFVTFYNARGESIYTGSRTSRPVEGPVFSPPDFARMVFAESDARYFHVDDLTNSIDIVSPVPMEAPSNAGDALYFSPGSSRQKEVTIGYIRVGISKDSLRKEEKAIIARVAFATFLGILAGLIILFISIRRVTVPLSALTEHVRLFGTGEVTENVPVTTDDEIGRLAAAFNTMSENIRRRDEEKALLQNRLLQSEKLESVGRLARGVAHDFNNILSTVQGSLFLIEKKFQLDGAMMRHVGQIQKSLARARALIQRIITFSRAQVIEKRLMELNSFIRRVSPALANIGDDNVNLAIALAGEDILVMGDPLQLEQLIINLVSNARDAMPEGGEIHVSTDTALINVKDAEKLPSLRPGGYAVIRVADTGGGIEEGTREKIFEPFFTTKENGKGTGLGLSIVYGVVEQHKGYIDVVSEKGRGTTFSVYLPLFEKKADSQDNSQ
ncbi:MAG: ATP-binding protein [Nitrospiraceae bacterium]|nr:ATP-binding protein [Nitrospiraceae bacterium]